LKDEVSAFCDQIDVLTEAEVGSRETITSLKATVVQLTEALSAAEVNLLVSSRAVEDTESDLARAHESRSSMEKLVEELKLDQHELQLQVEALTNQLAAEKLETYSNISHDANLAALPGASAPSSMLSRTRSMNNQAPRDHVGDHADFRDRADSMISVDLQDTSETRQGSHSRDDEVSSQSRSFGHLTDKGAVHTSNLMVLNEVTQQHRPSCLLSVKGARSYLLVCLR
jgi:hypothetical protein